MKTRYFETSDMMEVANCLKQGAVIAFPTDTVYGLGVVYNNENALIKLKQAKGRPENKPIPTMVASFSQLKQVAIVDALAEKLVKAFMPGAFTLVLKRKTTTPLYATNHLDTIGVRMPADEFLQSLIQACGVPLLVSSANISGEMPCINDQQVRDQFAGKIDGIILGEAQGKVASTIVDVSESDIKILRQGPISKEDILNTIQKEKESIYESSNRM